MVTDNSQINVYGLATINVNVPALPDEWRTLGTSRDGVGITEITKSIDLPTDYFGGTDGPPSEIALLGRIDRVRLELTKYDRELARRCRVSLNDANPQNMAIAGYLYFANYSTVGIWINTPQWQRVYQDAVVRENVELNKGTKFSRLVLVLDCYVRAVGREGSLPSTYVPGGPDAEDTGGSATPDNEGPSDNNPDEASFLSATPEPNE